jgi:hypothetical protein
MSESSTEPVAADAQPLLLDEKEQQQQQQSPSPSPSPSPPITLKQHETQHHRQPSPPSPPPPPLSSSCWSRCLNHHYCHRRRYVGSSGRLFVWHRQLRRHLLEYWWLFACRTAIIALAFNVVLSMRYGGVWSTDGHDSVSVSLDSTGPSDGDYCYFGGRWPATLVNNHSACYSTMIIATVALAVQIVLWWLLVRPGIDSFVAYTSLQRHLARLAAAVNLALWFIGTVVAALALGQTRTAVDVCLQQGCTDAGYVHIASRLVVGSSTGGSSDGSSAAVAAEQEQEQEQEAEAEEDVTSVATYPVVFGVDTGTNACTSAQRPVVVRFCHYLYQDLTLSAINIAASGGSSSSSSISSSSSGSSTAAAAGDSSTTAIRYSRAVHDTARRIVASCWGIVLLEIMVLWAAIMNHRHPARPLFSFLTDAESGALAACGCCRRSARAGMRLEDDEDGDGDDKYDDSRDGDNDADDADADAEYDDNKDDDTLRGNNGDAINSSSSRGDNVKT